MRSARFLVVTVLMLLVSAAAWAQAPVSATDVSRLDATATEIRKQAEALKKSDPTLATEVLGQLTNLTDEIAYMRVKLRRNEAITRDEYSSLRDRLETLRVKSTGTKVSALPALDEPVGRAHTVPVGTELDLRLQTPLSSSTAKIEDRFEATTIVDYRDGDATVIPAGSVVRGFVSSVKAAGKLDRKGSLTLSFDEIRIDDSSRRLRASVTKALDGKVGEDVTRIGAGAVVGGIIGGILGGGKGALIGVLVGGGGTIAATEGTDVELPVGTILRIRLDQPLEVIR
jgi:hypothetical protein